MPVVNLDGKAESRRFSRFCAGLMNENGTKQEALAAELGISQQCLSLRVRNKVAWTADEMVGVCRYFKEEYRIGGQG